MGAFGKDRAYYIMDRAQMGKFNPDKNALFQFAPNMTSPLNDPSDPNAPGGTGHIHCAPVVFEHPSLGPISYVWGENDDLRGFPVDPATKQFVTQTPTKLKSATALPVGMPGGMLTVSYNGATAEPKSAIVWASHPADFNANNKTVAGVLQAFAADDLTQPIWRSNHDPLGADDVGNFAKFCLPVVANGQVYMATFSNELVVYGLLPGGVPQQTIGPWLQADVPPAVPSDAPLPVDDPQLFRVEGSASYSCNRFAILGSGHDIWGNMDGFHFVYQAIGSGMVTITARLVSMTNDISPWSKAGIMIRETLDADSANAMVAVTAAMGVVFQYRQTKGGASAPIVDKGVQLNTAPGSGWIRLVRACSRGRILFQRLCLERWGELAASFRSCRYRHGRWRSGGTGGFCSQRSARPYSRP